MSGRPSLLHQKRLASLPFVFGWYLLVARGVVFGRGSVALRPVGDFVPFVYGFRPVFPKNWAYFFFMNRQSSCPVSEKIIWNTSKTKEVGLVHMDRWSIFSFCFKLEFRTAPEFLNKTIVKHVKYGQLWKTGYCDLFSEYRVGISRLWTKPYQSKLGFSQTTDSGWA